jgi:serine/threonine-protein kinase RsbW
MPPVPTVALTLPCEVEHLDLVHALTEQVGRYAGLEEQECLDLCLAVREAAVNGMTHGNGLGSDRPVEVVYRLQAGALRVEIRDRGAGFDPAEVRDPTAPENVCRSSGRGLLLIRSFVDGVSFKPRRGGGMVVTLSKKILPPQAPSGELARPPAGRGGGVTSAQ